MCVGCFKICHFLVPEQQETPCSCKVGHDRPLQRINNSSPLIAARLFNQLIVDFPAHIKHPAVDQEINWGVFPTIKGAKQEENFKSSCWFS